MADGLIALMAAGSIFLVGIAVAQETVNTSRAALLQACRADYQRLCSTVKPGSGAILACFQEHGDELSAGCKAAAIKQRLDANNGKAGTVLPVNSGDAANLTLPSGADKLPAGAKVLQNVAYGDDPAQRMDVYLPPASEPKRALAAPILFMVHGGGWAHGDKSMANVVTNKAAYWLPKGYVFVSVNNRLIPKADPWQQAQDVAAALAKVQAEAAGWNADPARVVLMGHSAGAHLVALVASDPSLMAGAGAKPVLGSVLLDSGALDVPQIMEHRHLSLYDHAFGKDPAFWQKVSPYHQLAGQPSPMLLVCSSRRSDSCPAAEAFAKKMTAMNAKANVLPEPMSHGEINAKLGLANDYTTAVEKFLQGLGLN
jgi:acetyl esterase/lipase